MRKLILLKMKSLTLQENVQEWLRGIIQRLENIRLGRKSNLIG